MLEIDITNTDISQKLKSQGKWLNSDVTGDVMDFEKANAKGHWFLTELEEGLVIQAWDGHFLEDRRLFCRKLDDNVPVIYATNFFVIAENCIVEVGTGSFRQKKLTLKNSLVFSTNRSEYAYLIKAGVRFRDFDIIFSHEWLAKQFNEEEIKTLTKALTISESESVVFEALTSEEFKIVDELLTKIFANDWDLVFLKSKAMTLLNEMLNRFLSTGSQEKAEMATGHLPTMIEIEKKLVSMLHEKMPNLEEIAKEFFMSESTLKRQFRQTYGKAIYEYYLDQKMELAKQMLVDTEVSIGQIAISLGYEKPSSFIKTFKKYFSVSPGSLRNEEV